MENSSTVQSIIKKAKKDDKYAQISNDLINNKKLSFKALGILTYILSKPDDWQVYISDLMRVGDNKKAIDGERSVRSGLKELIENKYMQRYRVFDAETGKIHHWETLVGEEQFSDEELISSVKETYLKDAENKIINQKIKFGNFERYTPIVINREVFLLCYNVHVENLHVENEGQQILINTKTDLNKNLNCSSSNEINLYKEFKLNICELRKTTKLKFEEILNEYDSDFILSIIEQCSISNIKSYAGFEKVFDSYLERNCSTRENVEQATNEYRIKHTKKDKKERGEPKRGKEIAFVENCEGRNYSNEDYENMEKNLLGWNN